MFGSSKPEATYSHNEGKAIGGIMKAPDFKITRDGDRIIISQDVMLMGETIRAMDIKDGETLTLDVTLAMDIKELAKLIDKDGNDPSKPGMVKRITESSINEIIRGAIQIGVGFGKSLIG